jgi:hypothetical protein
MRPTINLLAERAADLVSRRVPYPDNLENIHPTRAWFELKDTPNVWYNGQGKIRFVVSPCQTMVLVCAFEIDSLVIPDYVTCFLEHTGIEDARHVFIDKEAMNDAAFEASNSEQLFACIFAKILVNNAENTIIV